MASPDPYITVTATFGRDCVPFIALAIGDPFHFPHAVTDRYTKVSATKYSDGRGLVWTTGRYVAVVREDR